jgi:hypothetical protein
MAAKISKVSHPDRQQQQHDDHQLQDSEQYCSNPFILLEICASENREKDLITHSLTHSPFNYVEGVKKMLGFRSLEIIVSLLFLLLQHLLCVLFLLILLCRLLLPPEKLSFSIFHQQ